MKKKARLFGGCFLALTLSIFIFFNIYLIFFEKDIVIINKTVYSNMLPENNFRSIYKSNVNFSDIPIKTVGGIDILIQGNHLSPTDILLKSQRYYLPLKTICNTLNYSLYDQDDYLFLNNSVNSITLTDNAYEKNSTKKMLRGNLIHRNGSYYISISDIEEIFNLMAVFDFDNKKINFISNNIRVSEDESDLYTDKIALIRFEDFGCGYSNTVDKNQTKIKIMTNLLYSNGIKFHVSFIPHFIVPNANFDNDLLTNDTIMNVGFINLLDYIINKDGEIGLHGYTHQSGNDASGTGEEMSKDVNSTEAETRRIIVKGIDTAMALNIPISYYESPHYRETDTQRKIISEYFQFIYEPYDYTKNNIYKSDDNHLFVPTPLGRISDIEKDTNRIVSSFNDDNPDTLKSFYYHPSIEIDYIDFSLDGDKLNIVYDNKSPLKQLVKAIKNNDYRTMHIDELINK